MASTADLQAGRAFVRLYLKNDMSKKLTGVLRTAQSQLKKLGQSAMLMGRQLAFAGTAMTLPFALGTKTFADFDDAMRKVQARSHGTAKALADIRKQALLLGQQTVFTGVEVAKLDAILGKRGFERGDILKQAPGIVAFARGAGEGADLMGDLEDAATLTAGSLRAWGLDASNSGKVGDLMTAAVNNSALSMYTLGESMGYVAPLAAQAGYDLQGTLQTLGELSNIWIEGSRGGTTFRRMMLNLAGSVKKVKEMTGQDIAIENDAGGFRGLQDILKDIDATTKGLSQVKRLDIFSGIFGARAVTGAAGISRMTEGSLRLSEALDAWEGTAQRTADTMDAGLGGELRRLHSVIERVKIAIGGALGPVLQQLSKDFIKAARATVEWIDTNKGLVVLMAAASAGVIALGIAVLGLGVAATVASWGFGVLGAATASLFAVILGPISAIAMPFRLLGLGAQKAATVIVDSATKAGTAIIKYLGPGLVSGVAASLKTLGPLSAGVFVGMAQHAQIAFNRMAAYAVATGPLIVGSFNATFSKLYPAIRRFHAFWKNDWNDTKILSGLVLNYIKATWVLHTVDMGAALAKLAAKSDWAWQHIKQAAIFQATKVQAAWTVGTMRIAAAYAKLPAWVRTPLAQMATMAKNDASKIGAFFSRAFARIPVAARAAASAVASAFGRVGHVAARGIVAAMTGAFAKIRAMGVATGKRIGLSLRGGMIRGMGGALGGLAGIAGIAGAMGIGGALAPVLMMAPLVLALLGSIGTVISSIGAPVLILTAALAAGAVAWVKFSDSGKQAWAALMPIFDAIKTAFGGIKQAIELGNWGRAGQIAMAGLKLAVLEGLSAIQEAFPKTFNSVLRVFGKIGDGFIAVWDKVTGFMTEQWNGWGKKTLETVLEVAGLIPQIWKESVSSTANWILKMSADDKWGSLYSKILGVDMGEEQKKALLAEGKRKEMLLKNLAVARDEVIDKNKLPGTDVEANQKHLTSILAQMADLQSGGDGTGGSGTVDVLADASKAVRDAVEAMAKNVGNIGGKPGEGRASAGIESFMASLTSGTGVETAKATLDALLKQNEADQWQKDFNRDWAEQQRGAGDAGAKGDWDPLGLRDQEPAIPQGVALTATYSAAAASIGGYQPGGAQGPQEAIKAASVSSAQSLRIIKNSILTDNEIMKKAREAGNTELEKMGTKLGTFLAGWGVN